eukprot:12426263-Karenia_brevis.AAC.1
MLGFCSAENWASAQLKTVGFCSIEHTGLLLSFKLHVGFCSLEHWASAQLHPACVGFCSLENWASAQLNMNWSAQPEPVKVQDTTSDRERYRKCL